MVEVLQNKIDTKNPEKRITVSLRNFHEKRFEEFVTKYSLKLIKEMNLPQGFFQIDPSYWNTNSDYMIALEMVRSIKEVNDHAERGIALNKETLESLQEINLSSNY